jgi:hypothetical protein
LRASSLKRLMRRRRTSSSERPSFCSSHSSSTPSERRRVFSLASFGRSASEARGRGTQMVLALALGGRLCGGGLIAFGISGSSVASVVRGTPAPFGSLGETLAEARDGRIPHMGLFGFMRTTTFHSLNSYGYAPRRRKKYTETGLFTQVRGIGFLRTSPFGHSANLALTAFSEVHGPEKWPPGRCAPASCMLRYFCNVTGRGSNTFLSSALLEKGGWR